MRTQLTVYGWGEGPVIPSIGLISVQSQRGVLGADRRNWSGYFEIGKAKWMATHVMRIEALCKMDTTCSDASPNCDLKHERHRVL